VTISGYPDLDADPGIFTRIFLPSWHTYGNFTIFLLRDADMHSEYLLRRRGWLGGWLAVRHAPVDRRRVGTSRLDDKGQTTAKQL